MYAEKSMGFESLAPLIGHTPLLKIRYRFGGRDRVLFAKAEHYNLTGSIKDRVALHILRKAYAEGTIRPGVPIAEATSGNTGISFSAVGAALGHPVVIYMPDWMSVERIRLMESFGAEVRLVSREEGGFLGSIAMSEQFAAEHGAFLPCQFSNEDNVEAHILTTGEEIVRQLAAIGLTADGFVAGVGTGGTVMGIGRRRRAMPIRTARVCPLEPLNSPTLSTGSKTGQHRIYGISDEFIPPIVKLSELDDIVSVDDGDAIRMAQPSFPAARPGRRRFLRGKLSRRRAAAGKARAGNAAVVIVFADDNKKYLSTR